MTRVSSFVLVMVCASMLAASIVPCSSRAQAVAPPPDCGEELARRGDYEAAVEPMTRCFDRAPRMATAFNLAIVLRNAGQARRALALLDRIESGELGAVPASRRAALASQREATLASLATIVITLPGATAASEIDVDGIETQAPSADGTATFHVDPGEHAITVGGDVCASREVISVSRGDRREVTLESTPCSSAIATPMGEPGARAVDGGGDDGVLIGVGIGVGVAIVVGAIVLGVVLGSGTDRPDCTGGRACIETLVSTEPLLRF
ncbi:MAG: hypothetical protein J0L92_20335 [Deltaproteobacteria bacterium]|nr:hypothetical protein [Deltaproteobacteria bacterium]